DAAPNFDAVGPLTLNSEPVLRRVRDGGTTAFIVTVDARVPFEGAIRDDRGLADVRYHYELTRIEGGLNITASTFQKAGWAVGLPGRPMPLAGGLIFADATAEARKPVHQAGVNRSGAMPLPLFADKMQSDGPKAMPLARIKGYLDRPLTEGPLPG